MTHFRFGYKRTGLFSIPRSFDLLRIMKTLVLFLALLGLTCATPEVILEEEEGTQFVAEDKVDEKAAPWWEQQEELAKRRCQSSCTMHSKGVKEPQIKELCDDTDVSLRFLRSRLSLHF